MGSPPTTFFLSKLPSASSPSSSKGLTMFGMFNPMSAVTSQIPSVGGNEEPVDKEQAAEDERLRQEAIKEAEEKRRVKHKKMEEERENMRQGIRDRYKIEKREESEEEEDDDDDAFTSKKKDVPDDPMAQKAQEVKAMAEQGLNAAKDKCKVQ